jgi:hypothetical protein
MTYFPLAETYDTGEAYFTSLGLLGVSTGMAPLITNSTTIAAFSDSDGTALTITDSVAKAATGAAASWAGYNLSASKTKLLAIAHVHPSTSNYIGLGFHTSTLPSSTLENAYEATFDGAGGHSELGKYVKTNGSTTYTAVQTDATIYQNDASLSAVWGIALYVDGDGDIQRSFLKGNTGQWIQVLADTDTDHTSATFQSFYLRHYGESARFICPIYCWGA